MTSWQLKSGALETDTLLVELFILEAGGVICLDWALPEKEPEMDLRVQTVHLDAEAKEHGCKDGEVRKERKKIIKYLLLSRLHLWATKA